MTLYEVYSTGRDGAARAPLVVAASAGAARDRVPARFEAATAVPVGTGRAGPERIIGWMGEASVR